MVYLGLIFGFLFLGIIVLYVDTQLRLRRTIKALQTPISERDFSRPCRYTEPEKQTVYQVGADMAPDQPDLAQAWAQEQANKGIRVDRDTVRQQQAAWRRFEEED